MGLFGFGGKSTDVVDLAERQRHKKDMEAHSGENSKSSLFFDSEGGSDEGASDSFEGGTSEEKKRRLAKRLIDMTNRLDDISNKIYHLQQRVELLERKANIRVE